MADNDNATRRMTGHVLIAEGNGTRAPRLVLDAVLSRRLVDDPERTDF